MATRNYWIIENGRVSKGSIDFKWESGISTSQKRKSCINMHTKLLYDYGFIALDISSASTTKLGVSLSAFNLMLDGRTVECWYQGSKVYENYGPTHDLYNKTSLEAKLFMKGINRDKLVGFELVKDGTTTKFPANPKTAFYDWIYLHGMLYTYGKTLDISAYNVFTDIQAVLDVDACQARTVCEYKLIQSSGEWNVLDTFDSFCIWHKSHVETFSNPIPIRTGNVNLDTDNNILYYRNVEDTWDKFLRLITRVPKSLFPGCYSCEQDTTEIDESYCVIYTDALLDDLCAIEYLSRKYKNAVIQITNWQDLPTCGYAPDNYNVYKFVDDVRGWFTNVIFTITPISETRLRFVNKVQCYVLCSATAIVKDGDSNYNNIVVMGGYDKHHKHDECEWNASQDITSFRLLLHMSNIVIYTKTDCELRCREKTFDDLNLKYYNMYLDKMRKLGDSECCYDLQAVCSWIW